MTPFIGEKTIYMNYVSCYKYEKRNEKIVKSAVPELNCKAHEESDTKKIFHVCHIDFDANITIRCSDTDILIILLDNLHHIKRNLTISILFGTGNNKMPTNWINISDESYDPH
ncbi:hypothetical protein PV328_007743 [Microctonus aethiopoides]|uniref:Uncharacterized protein n=1 Tax=Microctonus aethiopoides TaxID=144406 RepID=A0AA39C9C6_9HYME|nr:hypothetical protein PV328_007743 [Microctonus aethiopoides]